MSTKVEDGAIPTGPGWWWLEVDAASGEGHEWNPVYVTTTVVGERSPPTELGFNHPYTGLWSALGGHEWSGPCLRQRPEPAPFSHAMGLPMSPERFNWLVGTLRGDVADAATRARLDELVAGVARIRAAEAGS